MKTLRIGNREVVIEYSFEASLDREFTTLLVNLLFDVVKKKSIDELTESIVATPDTVATIFYGGLLEHHGENGDKTIKSKADVFPLIKQYISEETDGNKNTYYTLMTMLLGEVAADKFIGLLGIPMMITPANSEKKTTNKKAAKIETGVMQ